jgi:NADH dehydrogenase [ubiquinone] 1 alpha subcomplex assembly factor 7
VSVLEDRIRGAILADGPMPVSLYMLMCLHDPRDGYYATRPAVGRDFTTAPETSQVFGELLGAWAVHEWRAMGSPSPFHLVELGPGRATMMRDMLRAAKGDAAFLAAMELALVEASPALRIVQAEALGDFAPAFADGIEKVPDGPAIILANEFLDCLPVRQFVRDAGVWRERAVGIDPATHGLHFGLGGPADLPEGVTPEGDEAEYAPGLETMAALLAGRFARHRGRAVFIDYGPARYAPGDTLRAFREGQQVDPLAEPGACDLTADVDFGRFARVCEKAGLAVHGPVEQGDLLERLGAQARVERLAGANPVRASEIAAAVRKLTAPDEMGSRFKAICLGPKGAAPPAGFPGAR